MAAVPERQVAEDPDLLGEQASENGAFRFLQVVGITADELDAMRRWNGEEVLGELAKVLPGLLVAPGRRSATADAGFDAAVRAGAERDGGSLMMPGMRAEGTRLELPTHLIEALLDGLRFRLPFGASLQVYGDQELVLVVPGDWGVSAGPPLTLSAPADGYAAIAKALRAGRAPAGWAGLEVRRG